MQEQWEEAAASLMGPVTLEITGGLGEIKSSNLAQCHYRNGSYYLLFEENVAENGKKGELSFHSRLKISKNRVSLKRSFADGDGKPAGQAMEIVYEMRGEGERGSLIQYPTQYGILHLEVLTQSLAVSAAEEELTVRIHYVLMQEGQEASRDEVLIRVTKK